LHDEDLNISVDSLGMCLRTTSLTSAASARSPRYQCYHSRDDARAGE